MTTRAAQNAHTLAIASAFAETLGRAATVSTLCRGTYALDRVSVEFTRNHELTFAGFVAALGLDGAELVDSDAGVACLYQYDGVLVEVFPAW